MITISLRSCMWVVVRVLLMILLCLTVASAQTLTSLFQVKFYPTIETTAQTPQTKDGNKTADSTANNTDDQRSDPGNSQPPSKATHQSLAGAKKYFKALVDDQKTLWSSPFQISKTDSRWIAPVVAATTILIATDKNLSKRIDAGEEKTEVSSLISRFGEGYSDFGFAGSLFAIGKIAHNERLAETGALGIRALINSSLIVTGLKLATRRERPNVETGEGHFFESGHSFPSGHAITVWSLATVVADEYRDKPLVRFAAFGLASAVSVSRVTGRNHFASDALVGSTLGYLIGHYTVKHYGKHKEGSVSTSLSPYVSPKTRTVGVAAALDF